MPSIAAIAMGMTLDRDKYYINANPTHGPNGIATAQEIKLF